MYLHFQYIHPKSVLSKLTYSSLNFSLSLSPPSPFIIYSTQSLSLPDRDPKGLGIGSDGLAVIATLQEIIVARDGKRVSGFKPSYEPTCVSFHPSQPEVVIGGKVTCVCVCVCVCVRERERGSM